MRKLYRQRFALSKTNKGFQIFCIFAFLVKFIDFFKNLQKMFVKVDKCARKYTQNPKYINGETLILQSLFVSALTFLLMVIVLAIIVD